MGGTTVKTCSTWGICGRKGRRPIKEVGRATEVDTIEEADGIIRLEDGRPTEEVYDRPGERPSSGSPTVGSPVSSVQLP